MDRIDRLQAHVDTLAQHLHDMAIHTRRVQRRLRWWRGIACGGLLVGLVSLPLPTGMATEEHADKDDKGVARRVRRLEAQVKALKATLAAVTFDATTKELVITGANLRIVNGLGSTDCTDEAGNSIPDCPNGLGNLIVGYNELRDISPDCEPERFCTNTRTGSHNVVVGSLNNFSSFGGLVVGSLNEISGVFTSVSGGTGNIASGPFASASGGSANTASGRNSSVSGGGLNEASGGDASISGGAFNKATRASSSVSGGSFNTASNSVASVSGGFSNTASGLGSSISGGIDNTAAGEASSVSGGENITTNVQNSWAAGSFGEAISGSFRSP